MKLIHLSDLHLGKRLLDCSLLEDQRDILGKIQNIVKEEAPQAVLIAGDIYDKSVPPAEAVQLFDDFLAELAGLGTKVFVISGNHDSPERIAFGSRLMAAGGVYLSPVYGGTVEPLRLEDEHGPVDIYLLPFLKPAHVRAAYPEEPIHSYTDALAAAIAHMPMDPGARRVLLAHQFVTGALSCDSEERSVGGSEQVDAGVFDAFDYVALGHLHSPQSVGRESLRYCGTPLKYSFSEREQEKSVTVVELGKKGQVTVRTRPLRPLRELHQLKGTFAGLMAGDCGAEVRDSYLALTLTDEENVPDAIGRLRTVYPHILKLDYDNARTRALGQLLQTELESRKSRLEIFEEFFEARNQRPMSGQQRDYVAALLEELGEEEP